MLTNLHNLFQSLFVQTERKGTVMNGQYPPGFNPNDPGADPAVRESRWAAETMGHDLTRQRIEEAGQLSQQEISSRLQQEAAQLLDSNRRLATGAAISTPRVQEGQALPQKKTIRSQPQTIPATPVPVRTPLNPPRQKESPAGPALFITCLTIVLLLILVWNFFIFLAVFFGLMIVAPIFGKATQ